VKNKDISIMLAGVMTATMVINPFINATSVRAEVLSNAPITEGVVDEVSDDYIYLSDLEYESKMSKAGYGKIMKDANSDGKTIKLLVDGEVLEYKRGIGAHATSTVVYDLSKYSDNYTRFVTQLGVDYAQKGRGNGVKFVISTSSDGKTWEEVKTTDVITPGSDSEYVDIDITGVKYLKLYANDNGNSHNDHAVYGNARILHKDYDVYSEDQLVGLMKLSGYDHFLKSKPVDYTIQNRDYLILQRALVNRVGYHILQKLYGESNVYREGIDYLLNNKTALKYFIANGGTTIDGSYVDSLKAFCNIYDKYKTQIEDTSEDNFNLRLAMSISLAYSRVESVEFWASNRKDVNAVTRYEIYQDLVSSGIMDKAGDTTTYGKWSTEQFKSLPIPMMKWVVDTRMNDDEIKWLADYALERKTPDSSDYLSAYSYINYTWGYNYDNKELYDMANYDKYNDKYHFGNYFNNYGADGIRRLWMVFEEGSVCGGLAKTYANIAEVFGRPSSVVGQPGHAATATYGWNSKTNQYEWLLQNNISGWAKSRNEYSDRMLNWGNASWCTDRSASYLGLATDAIETKEAYDKYVQATMLNLLADSYDDLNMKEQIYRKALGVQNINLDSFEGLVNVYKAMGNKTSSDYLELAKMIIDAYTYYPLPMMDLLKCIEGNITSSNDVVMYDLIRSNALSRAKVATTDDVKQPDIARAVAEFLLGENGETLVDLATFSFDGENAGRIIINDKYANSEIRVKYSLDGQKTWKETDSHVIELSDEEIAQINAKDDIAVGLVGSNDAYVIDIKEGIKTNNSTLYKNDLENRLIGKTENLLVSTDGGETWSDYTEDMRFPGRQVVKTKYKAHGVYLESGVDQYTFLPDDNNPSKKYVTLDHLSVVGYSSKTKDEESGEKVLSGSANDGWHSAANDNEKYITVELDSVKYITAIDYMSSYMSGKIKSADVYTSLDGENWVKSGSVSGWQNDSRTKTITLDEPTATKYVKIVATETHRGNSHFTCRMLNFYEDITKTFEVNPTINYSNTELTNDDVVVKIELPNGCKVVGDGEYTFTENGTHTFTYVDTLGVEKTVEAKVDWIDKEVPVANVSYSITESTDGEVVATIEGFSKDGVTILNNDSSNTYTFKENGKFDFEIVDKAGNKNTITAEVTWIGNTPTVENAISEVENLE